MNSAQTSRRVALKSMLRCCTRSRRSLLAGVVEVGLASIDWQIRAPVQTAWAVRLPFRTFHRLKMLGIEDTSIRASGSPALRIVRPLRRLSRKLSTVVIVASDEVHTSLAPSRIRTWSGLLGAL